MSRSVIEEVVIDATPDDVWRAITEGEGLRRWFPVDARVTPGLGGTIWLSWGEGMSGEAPITAWEPGRHLQWTEDRGPVKMAVDFHISTRDGQTVVRLVQSGFGDGPEWDGEFHMVSGGWAYFLANLAWYLTHHNGTPRDLLGYREPTALSRDAAYSSLCTLARQLGGVPFMERPETGQAGFRLAGLNQSLLFVEIEPGSPHVRGGFWLSTYGLTPDRLETLRTDIDAAYRRALAEEGNA